MPQLPLLSVIDDDDDVRLALGAMFSINGYAVQCFASAEAFLETADSDFGSVIISDLQMAGMNGLDLCRELRSRGITTPMILITAFATPGIRARALRDGIDILLEKPFDPSLLLEEVVAASRPSRGE